jgi:hypothetical protein
VIYINVDTIITLALGIAMLVIAMIGLVIKLVELGRR